MINDNGIIAGNITDKYRSQNPLLRLAMDNFLSSAKSLIVPVKNEIASVTEVGCGEGHFSAQMHSWGFSSIRSCDVSVQIIQQAQQEHSAKKIHFYNRSIYDISTEEAADLIVCVEVLEHLEQPRKALEQIAAQSRRYCLLSVPHEPWFRAANMARGKYLHNFGNTPGHLQHWSSRKFQSLVDDYFEIVAVRFPFPWIMILGRIRT